LVLSALNRRITETEARVGIVLLRRHDHGVEPAAGGDALLRRLGPLFDLLDRALADVEAVTLSA
jgi:DNA-binding transcriptional LysR family regulator